MHPGVEVWHYCEVNHVQLAIEGRKAVVNMVLPHAPVDFISYSRYDSQDDPQRLKAVLEFIASKLTPKPGIAGRRVFIGEYGFPAGRFSPAKQEELILFSRFEFMPKQVNRQKAGRGVSGWAGGAKALKEKRPRR